MTGLVLDTFAGPGGWDEGARHLGIHPLGVEWDHAACLTAMAAGHARVRADVSQLPTDPMVGKVTGFISSPPCQTFSMAGKGAGRDALPELQTAVEKVWNGAAPADVCPADFDVKSVLVLEPVRYCRDLRPEWIALEQVPAVLPIWKAFVVVLRHAGYSAWAGVLNSANYGVPQTRERAVLIASRVRKVQPPAPTHTKGGCEGDLFGDALLPWVSMAQALGWGMVSKPAGTLVAGDASKRGRNPLDGGSGARRTYENAQSSGDWAVRGQTEPAPTVVTTRRSSEGLLIGRKLGESETSRAVGGWNYVNGNQENACVRPADQPAPTVMFGHRSNDVRWVAAGVTGQGRPKNPTTDPADPICGKGTAYWTHDRPSTTVQGDARIWPPGHKVNADDLRRDKGAAERYGDRKGSESVRVTVQEAGVLQSFPADYPWKGSRTKQYEQVGNAIPPGFAMHVLAAATGLPLPTEQAAA